MSKAISKFALTAGMVLAFTLSCESDGGSSAFVGKWIHDDGSSLELFKDGTGVTQEKEKSMAVSWKVIDKRFVMTATVMGSQVSLAYDYEISGKKLTLTDDKGKKENFVRP